MPRLRNKPPAEPRDAWTAAWRNETATGAPLREASGGFLLMPSPAKEYDSGLQ
jgi:hypothetical protein